ncbi:hypothetical protein ACFLRC_02635 [Candidatus Altiarchaeota archaeon]
MHFIRQITEGKVEEWVHYNFIRYGRGSFHGPAINLQKSGTSIKANSTVDYANFLGELVASAGGSYNLNGKIVVRRDVNEFLSSLNLTSGKPKKKGSILTMDVKGTLDENQVKEFYQNLCDALVLVDLMPVEGKPYKLKCKKKPPKPGSGLDHKFCVASLPHDTLDIVCQEILFDADKKEFSKASINNEYLIEGLVCC